MKKLAINQIARMMCTLTMMVAAFANQGCRWYFYQPEEPSGLEEFAKRGKR